VLPAQSWRADIWEHVAELGWHALILAIHTAVTVRQIDWLRHANSISGYTYTANDMKIALISHGGSEGVRVVSMDTIAKMQDTAQTIAGITKLNNFEFTSTYSVTCWHPYGVGLGDVTICSTD